MCTPPSRLPTLDVAVSRSPHVIPDTRSQRTPKVRLRTVFDLAKSSLERSFLMDLKYESGCRTNLLESCTAASSQPPTKLLSSATTLPTEASSRDLIRSCEFAMRRRRASRKQQCERSITRTSICCLTSSSPSTSPRPRLMATPSSRRVLAIVKRGSIGGHRSVAPYVQATSALRYGITPAREPSPTPSPKLE